MRTAGSELDPFEDGGGGSDFEDGDDKVLRLDRQGHLPQGKVDGLQTEASKVVVLRDLDQAEGRGATAAAAGSRTGYGPSRSQGGMLSGRADAEEGLDSRARSRRSSDPGFLIDMVATGSEELVVGHSVPVGQHRDLSAGVRGMHAGIHTGHTRQQDNEGGVPSALRALRRAADVGHDSSQQADSGPSDDVHLDAEHAPGESAAVGGGEGGKESEEVDEGETDDDDEDDVLELIRAAAAAEMSLDNEGL